jgi:dolichol kinase
MACSSSTSTTVKVSYGSRSDGTSMYASEALSGSIAVSMVSTITCVSITNSTSTVAVVIRLQLEQYPDDK